MYTHENYQKTSNSYHYFVEFDSCALIKLLAILIQVLTIITQLDVIMNMTIQSLLQDSQEKVKVIQ